MLLKPFEIVFVPFLICTETRPRQASSLLTPLGNVTLPVNV